MFSNLLSGFSLGHTQTCDYYAGGVSSGTRSYRPFSMIRIAHTFLVASTMYLASCSAPSLSAIDTPIRHGMTASQLRANFGHPLRIERQSDGSEVWFHNFGTQRHESRPFSESTVSETERSYSFGQTKPTTTTMISLPIHLSPEGRVVGDIPAGSVIVE